MKLGEDTLLPDTIPDTICEALKELISGATLPVEKWPTPYRNPATLTWKPLRRFSMMLVIACWKLMQTKEKRLAKKVSFEDRDRRCELKKLLLLCHSPCLVCESQNDLAIALIRFLARIGYMRSEVSSQIKTFVLHKYCHCFWEDFCAWVP